MSDELAYSKPADFLQQGDIFAQDIVCPVADPLKRFFRSSDGKHGSVVFAGNVEGRVFSESELLDTLSAQAVTEMHTRPFAPTADGQLEFVVANATLHSYTIIASQTCDVSGADRDPLPVTTILSLQTLKDICQTDALPFNSLRGEVATIENFIRSHIPDIPKTHFHDPFEYSSQLKELLSRWNPPPPLGQEKSRILKFIEGRCKKAWQYPLAKNDEYRVPMSFVNLSAIYAVPRQRLLDAKHRRIATLSSPYKEHFAQALASTLSRIALPSTMAFQL